jgi:uncharacterized paraquat-inducible protein A
MQQPGKVEVQWGPWISEGWHMFAEQWGVWVVHMLVFFLAATIPAIPFYAVIFITIAASQENPQATGALILPLVLVFMLALMLLTAFLFGGTYRTALKQLRGEPISLGDLFSGWDCFGRMLGGLLLVTLLSFAGTLLCFFPAFIVAGLVFFTFPLIVDRGMGPLEAVQASVDVTRGDWLMFTCFAFVVQLIAGVGAFACYVGLLASYPLFFTISVIAYRDCFNVQGARRFGPATPPSQQPSYGDAPPGYTPPPPPSFGTTACPQCQATVSANASFCPRCGQLLR